jgi:hypothetical protein
MMIHFQADRNNSEPICLRASEVKPKLDRFIVKLFEKDEKDSIPKEWIQSKHPNGVDVALKYRMTIKHNGVSIVPAERIPRIFYGNTGVRNDEEKRNAVWFDNGLKLTILCFVPRLMEKIQDCIADFFIVTNFGTMQSKGFGSFTVMERESDKECDIAAALKENFDSKKCFKISVNQSGYDNEAQTILFDTIKQVYSVMKSGWRMPYERSYIYQYMHKKPKNIGNEKAFMKKKNVSPNVMTERTEAMIRQGKINLWTDMRDNQYYYVRALLGVGEQLRYKASLHGGWETIEISHVKNKEGNPYMKGDDKKIERVPSPIFFKVVDGNIYFVADRISEEIYEKYFSFFNKRTRESCVLPVPEESMFSIDDFVNSFVDHYNKVFLQKVTKKQRSYAKIYPIEEVKPCQNTI